MIKDVKNISEEHLREHYEQIWLSHDLREDDNYYNWILQLLKPQSGKKILDVGCGGGYLLERAEKLGLKTFGIDISKNALSKAKERCTTTVFIQCSAENLPFPISYFDYITCLGSLEHFINPIKTISEMKRVLKDTGIICIAVPNLYFEIARRFLGGKNIIKKLKDSIH